MAKDKTKIEGVPSKEERILEAARKIFLKKGYAATRTRDIAEEAGINLALLNYYFRSKEKLFNIIMHESRESLFLSIQSIFNDTETSIEEKFTRLANRHIDVCLENPNLPLFFLNEMQTGEGEVVESFKKKALIQSSYLFKQLNEAYEAGKIKAHPTHIVMSYMGMTMFGFFAKPIVMAANKIDEDRFREIMEERKKLIPIWMKQIMYGS